MKKAVLGLLCIVFALTLCGCGEKEVSEEAKKEQALATDTSITNILRQSNDTFSYFCHYQISTTDTAVIAEVKNELARYAEQMKEIKIDSGDDTLKKYMAASCAIAVSNKETLEQFEHNVLSGEEYIDDSFVEEQINDYINSRLLYLQANGFTYDEASEITFNNPAYDITEAAETNSEGVENTPSETIGEKNALSSARTYLSNIELSHSGLIDQLEYEGYSTDEATYAADNCGADWNEQAAKAAQNYIDTFSFSRSGLIEQLESEGYTREQAEYGVNAVGY